MSKSTTTSARNGVRNFIRGVDVTPRGQGFPCTVCNDPNRKEIENACLAFLEQRKLWGTFDTNESGEQVPLGTNIPWVRFTKDYLKPECGYKGYDHRPVIRHLENHLGIQVK